MSSWMQDGHRPHRTLPGMPNGLESVIKLSSSRKCLQAMLVATQGLQDEEVRAIATSIYALAKTVHTIRANGQLDPHPLLKMHLQEGLRRANCNQV